MTAQRALPLQPEAWPFAGLDYMGYGTILADPPWRFANYSAKGEEKNPVAHYQCMPTAVISALPVSMLAAPDCWLVCWATAPMLPDAIEVMRAWGFGFVTAGAWAKQSSTGDKWAFGTGYVRRSAAEFYVIGKHGEPAIKDGAAKIRNLIVAPVREHSRKPDRMYEEIEASFEGPYLDLFSRSSGRHGWSYWGDEKGKFAVLNSPRDAQAPPGAPAISARPGSQPPSP